MISRAEMLENLAGDLEYHPRKALLYFACAIGAGLLWLYSPSGGRFDSFRNGFALGGITLAMKGIFLMRKRSEGIGLTEQELDEVAEAAQRKPLKIADEVGQILQVFGAGPFLLWFLLRFTQDVDRSAKNPPIGRVIAIGAAIYVVGWLIRWASRLREKRATMAHAGGAEASK